MFLALASFSTSSSESASGCLFLLWADEEPDVVRLLFASPSRLYKAHLDQPYVLPTHAPLTYSSLSLRLRFPLGTPVVFTATLSLLLSSIALLSCSASSYAESRLFIVARRPLLKDSELTRAFLPSRVLRADVLDLGSGDEGSDFFS